MQKKCFNCLWRNYWYCLFLNPYCDATHKSKNWGAWLAFGQLPNCQDREINKALERQASVPAEQQPAGSLIHFPSFRCCATDGLKFPLKLHDICIPVSLEQVPMLTPVMRCSESSQVLCGPKIRQRHRAGEGPARGCCPLGHNSFASLHVLYPWHFGLSPSHGQSHPTF